MEALTKKKEILDWISNLDNPQILEKVYKIKKVHSESFEERFAKGITADELKEKTTEYLRSLPWKKSK